MGIVRSSHSLLISRYRQLSPQKMEAPAFRTCIQLSGLFGFRRVTKPKEFKVAVHKNLEYKLPSVIDKMEPRRSILRLIGVNLIFANTCAVLAAPMQEMREPEMIRTLKLANGVRIQDILEGEGKEAKEGDLVEFNYVCRRSNGYFVHSTVDQFSGESVPVVLPLDDRQMIKGLKDVLIGMKAGGYYLHWITEL